MDGALREAVRTGDATQTLRLLLGYYATGTDYRSYLMNVYRAITEHYTDDGHVLIFTHRSSQVLDMAGWADKLPAFIWWLTPHLANTRPDAPFLADIQAFLSEPAHDLKPLRTRLAPANDAAAGAELRQAILQGSLEETCAAVLAALQHGARGPAVGSVIALAAARRFLNTSESDADAALRAAHGLLVASAARTAVSQIQNVEVLPILFIAAAAINALRDVEPTELPQPTAQSRTSVGSLVGGILAPVLIRSLEQQLESGDEQAAQTSAHRYVQLGHPARGIGRHYLLGCLPGRCQQRRRPYPVAGPGCRRRISGPASPPAERRGDPPFGWCARRHPSPQSKQHFGGRATSKRVSE